MATINKNLRENDKFYFSEASVPVSDIIKTLVKELVESASAEYAWKLVTPTTVDKAVHSAILSTTTTFNETFYLKISRPVTGAGTPSESFPLTYLELAVGTEYDVATTDLKPGKVSPSTKFSWYHDNIDPSVKSWLPVTYWLNVTKDAVNIVFRGDPSGDIYPYEKFLTGYAYIGSVTEIESGQAEDTTGNFGITATSSTMPNLLTTYGPRTGTGVTDVCMVATKSGMPYQPHYPSFYTANPYMDKLKVEGSRWNNQKHQFSDVTLVHPVDMERGKLQNVLVGDDGSLFDNDKLVYKQDTTKQETYRKFTITTPYRFVNNSANPHFCVAIRCYNPDKTVEVENLG